MSVCIATHVNKHFFDTFSFDSAKWKRHTCVCIFVTALFTKDKDSDTQLKD